MIMDLPLFSNLETGWFENLLIVSRHAGHRHTLLYQEEMLFWVVDIVFWLMGSVIVDHRVCTSK